MRSQEDVAAMQCPVCRVPLAMSDRSGIEIDYCPQCRGVWLDRGELDKIIERSVPPIDSGPAPAPAPAAPSQQGRRWGDERPRGGYDDDYRHHQGGYGHHGKHKRRKSFLEELFD